MIKRQLSFLSMFISVLAITAFAESAKAKSAAHKQSAVSAPRSTFDPRPANGKTITTGHQCTDIARIPTQWVERAKRDFKVWYGHTSHGSQITSGMRAMNRAPFLFSKKGGEGSLSYQETGGDLGHRGDLRWAVKTRQQLQRPDNDRNVVMWSWCGGCSDNTEAGINKYLQAMTDLERSFPDVIFVYMTGHVDGSGTHGNLNLRNNQIRNYCRRNNKVLFDFADIESYDPDGNSFMDRGVNDGCRYRRDDNGGRNGNWADEWLERHPDHNIDLPDSAAHTKPLNGALKGRAFWWLLARLAGWDA